MTNLIDGLECHATWRNFALAVGAFALSNLALSEHILPNIQARQPKALEDGFLVMTDLQPLRSAEEVYRIFDLYTPDILSFVRLLYALDFVTPLAFGVCFFCLIGKMLRYLETKGPWRAALLVPFAAIPFDYTENALSLFLLGQYQDGQVFPTLARMAGIVTAAKFLGLGCMGVTLLAVLLRTGTKFIAQKAGSSRGS